MKKFHEKFLILATLPLISHAQYMRTEGNFISKSAELKTIVLDSGKGVIAASAVVTAGACSGTIAGIGKMKGTTLLIEPYVKVEGGERCVLRVNFDSEWTKAKMTEGENCAPYHGVACSWEGQEVKRKGR
jgi:hypothetical protein